MTTEQRDNLLAALAGGANLRQACEAAQINPQRVHERRRADPEFATTIRATIRGYVDRVEQETMQWVLRRVEVLEQPVHFFARWRDPQLDVLDRWLTARPELGGVVRLTDSKGLHAWVTADRANAMMEEARLAPCA